MAVCHGNVTDVAGTVVERLGAGGCLVDCQASGAGDEEVPFVALGVPVEFTHGAGVDGQEGRAEVGGSRESGRVDDFDGAGTRNDKRFLLGEVIGVFRVGLVRDSGWAGDVLLFYI